MPLFALARGWFSSVCRPSVTNVTQKNACAFAILADVQVSEKQRATSSSLARDLLAVMLYIQKHSGRDFYVLVEELDLTLTQLKALHALDIAAAESSVKELSEAMGLSLPAASRTVDGLLRRGYLERREDENDRRVKRLRLTQAGHDALDRLNRARLAGLEQFASTLTEEERTRLAGAIASLLTRNEIRACRPSARARQPKDAA
jgi:DNA-binding MarR family transcriptional regulator